MKFRKYIFLILSIALFLPLISGFSLSTNTFHTIESTSLTETSESSFVQKEKKKEADPKDNETQQTAWMTSATTTKASSVDHETEKTVNTESSIRSAEDEAKIKRAAELADGKATFFAQHLDNAYSAAVHAQHFNDDTLPAENQSEEDYQILSQMEYRIEYDEVTRKATAITWFYKQYTTAETDIINAFVTNPDGRLLRAEISNKEISYEESVQENIELTQIRKERELNQNNLDYFRLQTNIERKQPQEKGFYLTKLTTPVLDETESTQICTLDIITRFQGKSLAQRFSVDLNGALLLPFDDVESHSANEYAQTVRREFLADETAKSAGIAKSIRKTIGNLNVSQQDQIYGIPLLFKEEEGTKESDHSAKQMVQTNEILVRVFELSDAAQLSEIKHVTASDWNSADLISPGQLYFSSLIEQIKIPRETKIAETETDTSMANKTISKKEEVKQELNAATTPKNQTVSKKADSNLRAPLMFKVGTYDKDYDKEDGNPIFAPLQNAGFRLYKGGFEIVNQSSQDGLWYPDEQGNLFLTPQLDSNLLGLKPNGSHEYYTLVQDELHLPYVSYGGEYKDPYAPLEPADMQRRFRIENRAGKLYVSILEYDEQGLEKSLEYPYQQNGTTFTWTYPSTNFKNKESYDQAVKDNPNLAKGYFLYKRYQKPLASGSSNFVFRVKSGDTDDDFICGATFTLYYKEGDHYIKIPRQVEKLDENGFPIYDENGQTVYEIVKEPYTSDAFGYFSLRVDTKDLPDETEYYLVQDFTPIGYQIPKNEAIEGRPGVIEGRPVVALFMLHKNEWGGQVELVYPQEQEDNDHSSELFLPPYIIRNNKAAARVIDFVSIGYGKEASSEKLVGVKYQLMNEKGEYYFYDTTKNKDSSTGNYPLKQNSDGSLFVKSPDYIPQAGEEPVKFISDAQGNFKVGPLEKGSYILQQINHQEDYSPLSDDDEAAQFTVSDARVMAIYPDKCDENGAYILPQQYNKGGDDTQTSIEFFKKAKLGDELIALSGGEFKLVLVNEDGTETIINKVGAEQSTGRIYFEGLSSGNYRLYEVKAPDGYLRPENSKDPQSPPIVASFTIGQDGAKSNLTPEDGIILNIAQYELPTTGGIGVHWLTLGGTFLMTLSGGLMIKQNRGGRKKSQQKR